MTIAFWMLSKRTRRNIQSFSNINLQCLLYVFARSARKARHRKATASAASNPMFSQKFSWDNCLCIIILFKDLLLPCQSSNLKESGLLRLDILVKGLLDRQWTHPLSRPTG